MAKWKIKTDSAGNPTASFHDTVDGIKISAYMQDCDGEGVDWHVQHDGVVYACGEVLVSGNSMSAEKDAWDEAMKMANAYICAIPGYPMVFAFPPYLWTKVTMSEIRSRMFTRPFNEAIANSAAGI